MPHAATGVGEAHTSETSERNSSTGQSDYSNPDGIRQFKASIAGAEKVSDISPSPEQKAAENYRKSKFDWNGLNLAVETLKGEECTGKENCYVKRDKKRFPNGPEKPSDAAPFPSSCLAGAEKSRLPMRRSSSGV